MLSDILNSEAVKRQGPLVTLLVVMIGVLVWQSHSHQRHVVTLGDQHTQQVTAIVLRLNSSMSSDEVRRTLRDIGRGRR